MKRKICLVVLLFLIVAGGTFAQFSIDGAVSTNFNGITPSMGIGIGFSKLDLLAGVDFNIFTFLSEFNPSSDFDTKSIGIYAGLAPKVSFSEIWSLSFPLLAQFRFEEYYDYYLDYYSGNYYYGHITHITDSVFSFRIGTRADYAFSDHWSLYTGFLINAVSFVQTEHDTVPSYSTLSIFGSGVVQLGVIYTFGSSGRARGSSENTSGNNTPENQRSSSRSSRGTASQNQPREQNSVPQLGEPSLLQIVLNSLPAVPIGGKNLNFEFGGDTWIAKANGQNFLAGNCIFEENVDGYILTLTTTNVWSGAVEEVIDLLQTIGVPLGPAATPLRTAARLAAMVAKWVPLKGSAIILEYSEGPPAKMTFVRMEK
jgi:hypothetical protein